MRAVIVFLFALCAVPASTVQAHDGDISKIIDLSQKTEADGPTMLAQGWTVIRGKIVPPRDFIDSTCDLAGKAFATKAVTLPDIWGPSLTTHISSGHGVATYCLDVQMPRKEHSLALHLGTVRSTFAVYAIRSVADRGDTAVLLYRNGDPAHAEPETVTNSVAPDIALPNDVTHFKIVVQVANYIHKQGGITEIPLIDSLRRLNGVERRANALPTALVLLLSLVSLAALAVGRMVRANRSYVPFAFLTGASGFRVFLVSNLIWDYFPNLTLARKYDLEYLSLFMVAAAYYAFTCALFRNGRTHPIDKIIYGICALCCVFTLVVSPFLPPGTVTLLREPFQVVCLVMGLSLLSIVFRSMRSGAVNKVDALVVIGAALTTLAYELMSAFRLVNSSMELSQVLIIFVTVLYVYRFVVTFRRVETERDDLTRSLLAANVDLEARADALNKAFVRAEESVRAKSEFIATMSHELRTPLNAVIGFSEMMRLEVFGPIGAKKYIEYANDINASGTHLLAVVNDVLDLSRVETGNDELHEEVLDAGDIAKLVLSLVKPQAERSQVTCLLDAPADLPPLYADARKLKQILINLVSNAIKFNVAQGRVTVQLRVEACEFCIRVIDTGIGIQTSDIPRALTRFGQVDSNLNRKYEGLGIGLSIVQALSVQHGARLVVESTFGQGTTMNVFFPADRCVEKNAPVASTLAS